MKYNRNEVEAYSQVCMEQPLDGSMVIVESEKGSSQSPKEAKREIGWALVIATTGSDSSAIMLLTSPAASGCSRVLLG
jgi:hypothetical protein